MNYGWSSGGERFIIQGSSQNIKLWNKMSQNFKQIIKLYQQALFPSFMLYVVVILPCLYLVKAKKPLMDGKFFQILQAFVKLASVQ